MNKYCERCDNKHECELFRHVYNHEVLICEDYISEKENFRTDWFEALEDNWGEFDPDGFEW